jgi:hypothetical protein
LTYAASAVMALPELSAGKARPWWLAGSRGERTGSGAGAIMRISGQTSFNHELIADLPRDILGCCTK